jgi:hypothetical protein
VKVIFGDQDQVYPVRLVPDVFVDPFAFDLELLGREPDCAQDSEASRVRDGGDHVATMGKREDGEFDPPLLSELGLHRVGSPLARFDLCVSGVVPFRNA